MDTPTPPVKQAGKKSSFLVLGFISACFIFLIGTLLLMFEPPSSKTPAPNTPTPTTPHINTPSTEYPTIPPSAPAYTIPIQGIGDSGISGSVTFQDVAGAVAILLHLEGVPEEELLPVELRHGSCAVPGEQAYQVVSTDAGESETDLSINLEQFNSQKPLAIFVYRSAQDQTVLACGDIP